MSIVRRLKQVLGLGKERFFVGKDLEGNSFYEQPLPENPDDWRKAKRTVDYLVVRQLSDYRFHSLPVQWNAWLRRTRRDAPTLYELEVDSHRQMTLAANIERLAIEYKAEKLRLLEPPVNPSAVLASPVMREVRSAVQEAKEAEVQSGEIPAEADVEGTTVGEREKALLRRQFAKENPTTPLGVNPGSSSQPESWKPAPRRR